LVITLDARDVVPVAHPRQPEKQHEPYEGSEGHRANTLNSNRTSHRIQVADCCQHEEIENEDRGRRILALVEVAPRDDACRNIRYSHRCIVDQKRPKHDVSRISANKETSACDDRCNAE